jgi:hypothetical protein
MKISTSLKGRKMSIERWQKQCEINKTLGLKRKKENLAKATDTTLVLNMLECKICGSKFLQKHKYDAKKTCSRDCQTIASTRIRPYQNGSRKTTWYDNNGVQVLLESSWEVKIAKLLDIKKIQWIRPTPMKWVDDKNKSHLYYADFYLPKYNVYLDPKNPYCMQLDQKKMKYFETRITLIYGHINLIAEYINNL